MSEQNKQVVRDFIEAFSRGDAETAAACLAPYAVITARGFGKISGPRSYEMIVGTTGAFKTLIPTGLRPQFSAIIAEGNRVSAEFVGDATLVNGRSYCNEYCMTYVVEGGKIISGNEYFCTILADDRIGPLLDEVEQPDQVQ
jgi:ketosteroid isomerase-like protein